MIPLHHILEFLNGNFLESTSPNPDFTLTLCDFFLYCKIGNPIRAEKIFDLKLIKNQHLMLNHFTQNNFGNT